MGQSFFHFKYFSILQQTAGLKVTTDACVLGALASHLQVSRILDVGTGTGVLALMMAQKFPDAEIDAIEIEPVAAEQARYNFEHSAFSQQITLHQADVLQSLLQHYDLVICNPPYFKQHLPGSSGIKNTAIHNDSLPFVDLARKVASTLRENGLFWIILPPAEMQFFKNQAIDAGLFPLQSTCIYNKPGKHFRTVTCFSKDREQALQETELLICNASGARTPEFSQLMNDFYLENTTIYKRSSPDYE